MNGPHPIFISPTSSFRALFIYLSYILFYLCYLIIVNQVKLQLGSFHYLLLLRGVLQFKGKGDLLVRSCIKEMVGPISFIPSR